MASFTHLPRCIVMSASSTFPSSCAAASAKVLGFCSPLRECRLQQSLNFLAVRSVQAAPIGCSSFSSSSHLLSASASAASSSSSSASSGGSSSSSSSSDRSSSSHGEQQKSEENTQNPGKKSYFKSDSWTQLVGTIGAIFNWSIPAAAIANVVSGKDASTIDPLMTSSLAVYSLFFMRWALAISPANYPLLICHISNEAVQLFQLARWANAKYTITAPTDSKTVNKTTTDGKAVEKK